jgi:hypothetical protein
MHEQMAGWVLQHPPAAHSSQKDPPVGGINFIDMRDTLRVILFASKNDHASYFRLFSFKYLRK